MEGKKGGYMTLPSSKRKGIKEATEKKEARKDGRKDGPNYILSIFLTNDILSNYRPTIFGYPFQYF
jgi:hypothetical protein